MSIADDWRADGWLVGAMLAALSVVGACANDVAPTTPTASAVGQEVSSDADAGQPKPSHEPGPQCLLPPWTPAADSSLNLRACNSEYLVSFILGDGEPIADAELSGFLDRHRTQMHELEGVVLSAWGLCCSGDWSKSHRCIRLGVRLCTTPVSDLAQELERMRVDDGPLVQGSLNIVVELQGRTGPRCDPGECGPVPYEDEVPVPTGTMRDVVRQHQVEQPDCGDDGDCIKDGCGNECLHWAVASGFGTCQREPELVGAACGCVESRCSWFK